MSDYIKREDVIKRRHGCQDDCQTCDFAVEHDSWCSGNVFVVDIIDIPAADVLERKRGHWDDYDKVYFRSCSECGFLFPSALLIMENFDFNFCPNCGADMRVDNGACLTNETSEKVQDGE